jgi:hypothetical protein
MNTKNYGFGGARPKRHCAMPAANIEPPRTTTLRATTETEERQVWALIDAWSTHGGDAPSNVELCINTLVVNLRVLGEPAIREAMAVALRRGKTDLRYAFGVLKQWREEHEPAR